VLTANRGLTELCAPRASPGRLLPASNRSSKAGGDGDVFDAQLSLGVRRGAPRREGGSRRHRHGVPDWKEAERALEGADLLGDVLSARVEVQPRHPADRAVELESGLAEPVPRQLTARARALEEGRHSPRGPDARVRLAESRDRRGGGGLRPGQVLADEVESGPGERAERVVRLLHQLAAQELAHVSPHPQVEHQREARPRVAGVLHVPAHQIAAEPLRRSGLRVVLVGGIVEQPLVLRVQAERAEGRALGDRNDHLGRAGPLLAAVVRKGVGHRRARIARIPRRRRAHRIGVHPARDVERRDEAEAPGQRALRPKGESIESAVEPTTERPVALVGDAALPCLTRLAGHHVHQAGERLAEPGGESVGHQRRFAQEVGRDLEPEPAARRVELVLHPESVEDERLLSDPAAAVAGADASGGERERLLQRADRQVAKVLRADLLLGARCERVEHRVVGRGHHQRLELEWIALEVEVHRYRRAGRHEDAVEHDPAVPD